MVTKLLSPGSALPKPPVEAASSHRFAFSHGIQMGGWRVRTQDTGAVPPMDGRLSCFIAGGYAARMKIYPTAHPRRAGRDCRALQQASVQERAGELTTVLQAPCPGAPLALATVPT
jgi:hypothetical protein